MESLYGDTEESTEDIPGRKKSKLKSLKTRLFGRSKRAGGEENYKLSQSESDITAGNVLGSEEDLACSQGMMGSRALSHDSIFLDDQVLTDAEPTRILSQENVHSKIKALQIKLQQQKLHLGPPPLVLPIRRPEDVDRHSEDDGLPRSPPESSGTDITTQAAPSKVISQPFSYPLSPIPKPAPTKLLPLTPSHPLLHTVPSNPSVVESPADFSSPAQFTPCLDSSAARHRMSVKPRNQRASTKRRLPATDSRAQLDTLNSIDHPESVTEERSHQEEGTLETGRGGTVIPIIAQCLPSKFPEEAPITPESTSKSSSVSVSHLDQALPASAPSVPPSLPPPVLRVKPPRPTDVKSSERPHSSFIPSELKDKREDRVEITVKSHDKSRTPNKAGMTEVSSDQPAFGSTAAFRSSSGHQQVQGETESTGGLKRLAPGSGSFHFSITAAKNRDVERPRSGSFVEVLQQTEARRRMEDKPFSSMKEKVEHRDSQSRGHPYAVGRPEGAPHRASFVSRDRRDSLKKVELVTPLKTVTATDAGAGEVEELESSQEVVEEAVEAKEVEEDEGKTAFGIKLRSTSQSLRFRSDVSSNHNSKPPVCEEQCGKPKRQEMSNNSSNMVTKLSTNVSSTSSTSGDVQLTDPPPVKQNLPATCDPCIMPSEYQTNPKEVENVVPSPQEPQPAPQTAPSEMSWMSLAMEKTRSLQQLFTSRFPRDLTGVQAAARPQAQAQTTNQTETLTGAQLQTQTVKIQQSTNLQEAAHQATTETVQIQAQTVKPSLIAVQPKTASPVQSNPSREAQASKQTNEPHLHPNTASPQTTPPTVHPAAQTETSSQFPQGAVTQSLAQSYLSFGQQQLPRGNRGAHAANQPKPAPTSLPSASSATAPPPPVSASERGETEATVQKKEAPSLPGRRAFWIGSVSEKAAFLEKRAEWTPPPGSKGVEVKKAQTEVQTSDEPPASAKATAPSKDTKPEGAESSPTKVPDRPREDKLLRKNVSSSASPSSSPPMPSALQSMSDSGQPSWMELAKRKSMAWSDKSME